MAAQLRERELDILRTDGVARRAEGQHVGAAERLGHQILTPRPQLHHGCDQSLDGDVAIACRAIVLAAVRQDEVVDATDAPSRVPQTDADA